MATKKKLYYGFRYFSGKRTTTGEPNAVTGDYSIAGDSVVFGTLDELNEWLDQESYEPSGLGGGRRITISSKKELRKLNLGCSVADFERFIEEELYFANEVDESDYQAYQKGKYEETDSQ